MFSIAAINDPESCGQWEPLAPTKEAQESHLTQTYHEGLLKLQAKDYTKARELLEAVLKDPLTCSSQIGKHSSDGHLLQLRFLSLKNLATVFLQQGPLHYNSALQCYVQAVEIDANDSVVWNQLGTLSCTMGLLSTARWAFEQGLLCSPNNWNCMEKLLEVLIAIGDEVACLSVAYLILRHWPSHSRALHVKNTIEDAEPVAFAPRGIDKLKPKHVRLKFPDKRKAADDEIEDNTKLKRRKQKLELQLAGANWAALADAILGILLPTIKKISEPRVAHVPGDALTDDVGNRQGHAISVDASVAKGNLGPQTYENIESYTDIRIDICLPSSSEIVMDSLEGIGETTSIVSYGFDEVGKEKEIYTDKEHPQERRSSRLERLRSRKSGKEDMESSNSKDLEKVVFRFLGPFIYDRSRTKSHDCSGKSSEVHAYSSVHEYNDVVQFISRASKNSGAFHIAHLLLEEVANMNIPFQEGFSKFLEIEKLTRHWGQDRTPLCSLYLAELCHDQGSCTYNESKQLELFSEASYHLCKVIELVALDSPYDWAGGADFDSSKITRELDDLDGKTELLKCVGDAENMPITSNSCSVHVPITENSDHQEIVGQNPVLPNNSAFWVRFFWLSGCLSLYSGNKTKAFSEFCICLGLLRSNKSMKENADSVFLPHCRLVRSLTVDRILHEINLLKLDALLEHNIEEMIDRGNPNECIDLLSPLLLSTKDVYLDMLSGSSKETERVISLKLSAINVLLSACEKAEPMNIEVLLNCHRLKLQILTVAAGMLDSSLSHKDKCLLTKLSAVPDVDNEEGIENKWKYMVSQAVKDLSQCTSRVKHFIDQSDNHEAFNSLHCIIGEIQSHLMTVMCSVLQSVLKQKVSGSGPSNHTDQLESWCLVDAAIAFCKLQHLDPSVPIKTQVDLIVGIHDLLAEYGLCCAGRDSEGEEGTFLKLAIKHLLALDMKLKSLIGTNGKEEGASLHKDALEGTIPECLLALEQREKEEEGRESRKNASDAKSDSTREPSERCASSGVSAVDGDIEKLESAIDSALDQSFFCLYGLDINPDSSSEDELVIHKNTSRGDYQTKEQCADVFQYILPYAGSLSRAGLIKLRRVFRAIRKHFPQPPDEILAENAVDKVLDSPDLCEDKLSEVSGSDQDWESIMNLLFPNGRGPETYKALSIVGSKPYFELYSNLYYFIAHAEDISATDKHAGFVLRKEGEEFVDQSANLFKYDLLYNPKRFESWRKLANIYDEEVDLLLNDGSKHINIVDWRKNTALPQRVESGRRRSRRCLLMSLALAKTPIQQSEISELLALVYYDSLQNVVPFYDQRSILPAKNAAWMTFCQNSMKHFEKAFDLKPDWLHAFYLGKLCEKLGYSPDRAFSYYDKAVALNPTAVEPFYRMHASRLKLLNAQGKQNLDILQIVAAYSFNESSKVAVLNKFSQTGQALIQLNAEGDCASDDLKEKRNIEPYVLGDAWNILFDDCRSALEVCVEGELKHFHKARYMLAQGFHRRGEVGDLERAKDELSFCFKSTRSSFTINLWEIDGSAKRGRRKNPGHGGNKRYLEVSLSESSRKFITCIRKYILVYLNLLEKSGDLATLERAYAYLRTDKRFSLCIGDIIPITLGKYIQVLVSSIRNGGSSDSTPVEQMLEKMFNIFMDHVNLWTDICSLPEVNNPDLSESGLYGYIHQYIHLLESDTRLEALESINEKIRKRFKSPKLSNSYFARICKHASLAWCRSILFKLASITPLSDAEHLSDQIGASEIGFLLFVDLQADELMGSSMEGPHSKGLDLNLYQALSRIKHIHIQQASEENLEAAAALMRCTYNFYRESSSGALPSGVNLYTVFSSQSSLEGGRPQPDRDRIESLDLSMPRKLLLWAYTLVHGRYSNISAVVKYCEENAKSRMKRGAALSSGCSQANLPTYGSHTGNREKGDRDENGEVEDGPSALMAASTTLNQENTARITIVPLAPSDDQKFAASSPLHRCNSTKRTETSQDGFKGNNPTD